MRKSVWMISAACLLGTVPAYAQDSQSTETASERAAAAQESAYAGDIVVTATRRAEALSDIPIAVSAVTGETLRNSGAFDIRQLNQLAPSLLVSSTGTEANGSARIRGVGTVGDNPGLESSVAVFIDGVYRSRSGIGLNELGEIERIEVLRGPQGTLFGRNASAGLIHIISKTPSFDLGGYVEGEYGNYDYYRLAGAITGGLTDTLAARLDAVYVKRDGFLRDETNDIDVNNRDRLFLRGQLFYEPTEDLTVRLIGDYTTRDERCCGAVYLDAETVATVGRLLEFTPVPGGPANRVTSPNSIIPVLVALGQPTARFSNPYSRIISPTPGRSYDGETEDWGVSAEVNWTFGGATLTSITAYRDYVTNQGSDTDYSFVDILYREPGPRAGQRQFQTFTQELRLQGSAFDERLDWLVGGFFADEDLTLNDNLRFGSQYGRFASCRFVNAALGTLFDPTSVGCLSPQGQFALRNGLTPLGAVAGTLAADALGRLDALNDRGSINDRYFQNSRNWAIFTHNIFHITDRLDLTLGLRYTDERKRLNATFSNDNTVCVQNQAALGALLQNPATLGLARSIIGLSCQGNSTAELDGVSIRDRRNESEFTGTAVVSYKPNDDTLLYASYSRGYKAGGFNLDRSALKDPVLTFSGQGGAQALARNLQFDQEINDAFEIGIKYSTRNFSINAAAFRQQFKNFQLNTFNGTFFLVQNINGCGTDLGPAQSDQSVNAGAPNFVPPTVANPNPAASTGACAPEDVQAGIISQGIELEASLRPTRFLTINLGYTYADTKFRENLVGTDDGAPLDPALRRLPGTQLSLAPSSVATAAVTWTPPIGSSGMTGLVYFDARNQNDNNTGSDVFPQKEEDGFTTVNARIGIRGQNERWALELWAQNLLNTRFAQVAFNSPFQAGGNNQAVFPEARFPGGTQIFSAFLGEPRTYGLTLRSRF
jgi:iron complex outermembrane receptor protein